MKSISYFNLYLKCTIVILVKLNINELEFFCISGTIILLFEFDK